MGVQNQNRVSKRWVDGSLAKTLTLCLGYYYREAYFWVCPTKYPGCLSCTQMKVFYFLSIS